MSSENKNYKLVIFDLDGTILNSIEDLTDACNFCLEKYNMPTKTVEDVTKVIGNGILSLVKSVAMANTDDETINKMFLDFVAYYKEHCDIKTKAYDGVIPMLMNLKEKGLKLALLSNKADAATKKLCEKYFSGIFDICLGEREGVKKKPFPDAVYEIMRMFNVNNEEVLYIGDSDIDFNTAKNASVDFIAVSYGYRSKETLLKAGATKIIDSPDELLI